MTQATSEQIRTCDALSEELATCLAVLAAVTEAPQLLDASLPRQSRKPVRPPQPKREQIKKALEELAATGAQVAERKLTAQRLLMLVDGREASLFYACTVLRSLLSNGNNQLDLNQFQPIDEIRRRPLAQREPLLEGSVSQKQAFMSPEQPCYIIVGPRQSCCLSTQELACRPSNDCAGLDPMMPCYIACA